MLTSERLGSAAAELAEVERFLAATATRFASRSRCLRAITSDSTAWWAGPRAESYRQAAWRLGGPLTSLPTAIGEAHRVVGCARRSADDLAVRLESIDRELTGSRARLGRYRSDVEHEWSTPADEARVRTQLWQLERERERIEIEWTSQSRAAAATIEHVARSMQQPAQPDGFGSVPTGFVPGRQAGTVASASDPGAVARWWDGLDAGAREALIALLPVTIGNLDGLPTGVRVDANRRSMQRALDRAVPGSEQWRRLQQFTDPDRAGMIDADRQFLVFDPAGDGLIAEVFGDLGRAEHVAVLVPGMGSTLAGFAVMSDRAERLHRTAGDDTAVVAWTGYDTPDGAALTSSAFEVVSDRQAVVGGERLHRFVDGLRTEAQGTVTLVGHSYGSLTVGRALLDGVRVDRVVFMGSPGVGVDHVDEFPPGAAQTYFASDIKGDVVANLEHFGTEPTDPDFGAEVFDSGDGDGLTPISRHGEYYDDGIALDNLSAIITGEAPTPGRTDVIEYVTEPMEDVQEAVDSLLERLQEFDIPLADDTVVDGAIEVVQQGVEVTEQVRQVVLEEAGHFAQDAAEWGVDRLDDAWTAGSDFVTGWFG